MMKHSYKRSVYLLFCFFLSQLAFAQAQTTGLHLTGTVIDSAIQKGIIGAAVGVKGSSNAVATDAQGNFSFATNPGFPFTVIVTYIGYEKKEFKITSSPVTIVLKENVNQLNDVVITGYSNQERKFIAGSITSVSGNAIKDLPEAGFNQALQGKAAALMKQYAALKKSMLKFGKKSLKFYRGQALQIWSELNKIAAEI